jgi:hypothetical protein
MSEIKNNNDFLWWEVKPYWKVSAPSIIVATPTIEFPIYGVDRSSGEINRDWERIHSVEQFNQGFVAKPTDIRFTIAVKEHGKAFEQLRRLAKGGILFDVTCDLITDDVADSGYYGDNKGELSDSNFIQWMDGFEKYVGCVVSRESQTVEIGTFPIREFECMALRHVILENAEGNYNTSESLVEGDGTFPDFDDLNLS